MPTLQDVFAKFGDAAEAAQLLETELGNLLLAATVESHGLAKTRNKVLAKRILLDINRQTLGQLIQALTKSSPPPPELEDELMLALTERNRLHHSFYREHNFRRNSEEGRMLMIADLNFIHERILQAYKSVLLLSGTDITNVALLRPPTKHLPI